MTESEATTEESFISSNRRRVHCGTPAEAADCGTRQKGSWGRVDADDAEEAVMGYNLIPCIRCIDDHYQLERWRKDVHTALAMNSVDDTPARWTAPIREWDGSKGATEAVDGE